MSKKISVLLLEDINNLGQAGDILSISEGYARNFLFPQGRAAIASNKNKQEVAIKKKKQVDEEVRQITLLQKRASDLEGSEIIFIERIKDGDVIYGKVTAAKIAKELSKQSSLDITTKNISLPEPISKLGTYNVTVALSADAEAAIKVIVEADPSSQPADDE